MAKAPRAAKPVRMRVAVTLGNRDSTTDKDGRILNGYAEVDGQRLRAVKRPGQTSRYALATGQGGATIGQLLFVWRIEDTGGSEIRLVGIRGDKLTAPV